MQLAIEKAALFRALQHVTNVVERRTTIPILSNVLLAASDGALRLKTTDLDIEVSETIGARVASPGQTTVSAHMLTDIVRKLPEGAEIELSLEDDGGRLALAAGRARFTLQALPAADFPDLSADEMTHRFTLPAPALRRLIEKTRFAISTEETRYYLGGIYLHAIATEEGDKLCAVATDGHRLAKVELPLPQGAADIPGVIIPRKTVQEAFKLLADRDEAVTMELSPAKIRFIFDHPAKAGEEAEGEAGEATKPGPGGAGTIVLTSKLIDGTFPDYQRVIPTGNDKILSVPKADFAAAVDRVSTLSIDKGRAVKLEMTRDRVVLSVNNPDTGSATEDISAEYTGEPLEIGFNARYLLDICAQIEGDNAIFLLADPSAPTLIKDQSDKSALYVIMPMRV